MLAIVSEIGVQLLVGLLLICLFEFIYFVLDVCGKHVEFVDSSFCSCFLWIWDRMLALNVFLFCFYLGSSG